MALIFNECSFAGISATTAVFCQRAFAGLSPHPSLFPDKPTSFSDDEIRGSVSVSQMKLPNRMGFISKIG
jgi:hypothetical protein